jgi:hypothetical protein
MQAAAVACERFRMGDSGVRGAGVMRCQADMVTIDGDILSCASISITGTTVDFTFVASGASGD